MIMFSLFIQENYYKAFESFISQMTILEFGPLGQPKLNGHIMLIMGSALKVIWKPSKSMGKKFLSNHEKEILSLETESALDN